MEHLDLELSSHNKPLVRINKQIAIVHKLLASVNRDKIIQFLSQNELFFSRLISRNFPLNEELLIKYTDDFDWGYKGISRNSSIVWNNKMLDSFSSRLNWTSISWYSKNPMDILYSNGIKPDGLSKNENINWSIEFIDSHLDKLDFDYLCWNPSLPWSFDFIEYYKENWNWGWQLKQKSLFSLSMNPGLPWSEELIEKYFDKWDWEQLSLNSGLPWSVEFLEKYKSKWIWGIGGLSNNASLPWTISLIEKYKEKWKWGCSALSSNEGLPWSIELLRRHKENWDQKCISKNDGIMWTESMILEVRSWGFSEINPYSTKNSPWNIDYLIKNYNFIKFHKVYEYENLWQNVFKEVLDYETVIQILESNRKKKSYKVFEKRKQFDVLFDEFLFEKDVFWESCITHSEMKFLKEYFNKKLNLYNFINSEQAYNDIIENRKSIRDIENLIDELILPQIEKLLLTKVQSPAKQFVFSQQHEMIQFLTNKLSLPNYLQNLKVGQNRTSQIFNWFKGKFS